MRVHCDDQIVGTTPITITAEPKALKVLVETISPGRSIEGTGMKFYSMLNPRHARFPTRAGVVALALVLCSGMLFATSLMFSPALHARVPPRKFAAADIRLVQGYRIEAFAANLTDPTAALFDGQDLLIAESGRQITAPPRVIRVRLDGSSTVVASRGLRPPVTGLLIVRGRLYVSHRGSVSVLEENGRLRDIIRDLPSDGDYQNSSIVLGPDGRIYMGQGTVTNAGVVGLDSFSNGWLDRHMDLHDIPCQDITLLGQNYRTINPLDPARGTVMLTGAYEPFGSPSIPDQVVKGDLKCNGSILSFNPDGSDLRLVAWGLRNPLKLVFDGDGQLWATNQGAEVRGSRNIHEDPDYLVKVEKGAWYGWPDYFDGRPVTDDRFRVEGKPQSGFLWDSHPPLSHAFMTFPPRSGASGLGFSPGKSFGLDGNLFVAMLGPTPPSIGSSKNQMMGWQIARVDLLSPQVSDFASNIIPGPAYLNQQGGFDRPADILFGPDASMYVVDSGGVSIGERGLEPIPLTGAVWRIYSHDQHSLRPNGPILLSLSSQNSAPQRDSGTGDLPELFTNLAPLIGFTLGILAALVILGTLIWQWMRPH